MISSIFVDRPRLAIVIAIVIVIAGALAITRIPVAQFPEIVPPQVQVSATYPGASAAVVEQSVAQPLEAQIVGVDQMLYMKSTSGNDGSYGLTVSFALGTNPDIDTVNVNNRVQTALSQLPSEVQQEGLTVQKRSSAVLQFMMLYSENGRQDPLFITNYAIINILDAISRVPGVGQASLFSRQNYSMRIWFDTERLINLGLAPSDVINAIQAQNVQAPVGRIGARPIGDDQQFQLNVQTQGRLVTPEEFGRIVLRANPDGSVLRVSDVARVEMGPQSQDSLSRLDGSPAVAIGIYQSPGANAVATAARVNAVVAGLSQRFPQGMHALVMYDATTFVSDTIREVLRTIVIAFVLVVLVVFLFLGNLRATIIPAVAVPVSLIGTFAALLALGYTANTVSLLALVLAIGVVVDDAIVVVENVERHIEEGLTPREASYRAMEEVSGPIIAIALVLCAVFVPVAFISGLTGQFYRQFALTIAFSTLISAFNSLTLSPALAALLLKPHNAPQDLPTRIINRGLGWLFGPFNRGFAKLSQRYGNFTGRITRRAGVALVVYAGLVALGVIGFAKVPAGFVPTQDKQYLVAVAQLPDAASLDRTDAVVRRIGE
ncbi:MAG: efflux RND transporter permease subunit, partial [Acidisphaera sp.]|nr:efflux RND transporter permease subunit [Acidisphaera sp.]